MKNNINFYKIIKPISLSPTSIEIEKVKYLTWSGTVRKIALGKIDVRIIPYPSLNKQCGDTRR